MKEKQSIFSELTRSWFGASQNFTRTQTLLMVVRSQRGKIGLKICKFNRGNIYESQRDTREGGFKIFIILSRCLRKNGKENNKALTENRRRKDNSYPQIVARLTRSSNFYAVSFKWEIFYLIKLKKSQFVRYFSPWASFLLFFTPKTVDSS